MNEIKTLKKIITIMFMILFTGAMTGVMSQSTPAMGDVNNNGDVDIIDALLIAQFYVGLVPEEFIEESADVNGSGDIDIIDALLVARYYVGLIDSLSPVLEDIFYVQEFTSQKWYGGVMGSGGGTDFHSRLTVIVPGLDTIEGIWVDNRYYLPDVTNLTSPGTLSYVQGDELEISFEYRWIPDMPELGIEPVEDPPLEQGPFFTGAALIICRVNGTEKGCVVDVITELEPIYYP